MFIKIMSLASVLSLGATGTAIVAAEPDSTLYPVKAEIEQVLNIQWDWVLNRNNDTAKSNNEVYINAWLQVMNK